MENRKVIIIGGGIGGLSAASWLIKRGYEVEILEASDRPGGRMRTLERNGDRIDVGAQFYHSNYRRAFELMEATKLTATKRKIGGKIQFALKDGSSFRYNHNVPFMPALGLRGNLKLYWFVLKHVVFGRRFPLHEIVEDLPELDDMECLDLFPGPSGRSLRDFLVMPLSLASNDGWPEYLNAYHLLHLFRIDTFTKFVGLTRGVASLAEELANLLPVQFETPVRQLVVENGRTVGVQLEGDGAVRKAGHMIVAVTPRAAVRLLPDELADQRGFFDSVTYAPIVVPVFFLDRPIGKDVWCYFYDPGLRPTFSWAIDGAAKLPEMVPSGRSILAGFSAHPLTLDLIDQSDDAILKQAQQDMELMLPGFSQWIEDTAVVRHPYGVARYPTGSYRRVLDFKRGAETLRGVSFVSDLFGGCYMEPAMRSAAHAVSRVCQWGGTG